MEKEAANDGIKTHKIAIRGRPSGRNLNISMNVYLPDFSLFVLTNLRGREKRQLDFTMNAFFAISIYSFSICFNSEKKRYDITFYLLFQLLSGRRISLLHESLLA